MKVANPFPAVSILLPDDVVENNDEKIFSYWRKNETCLLQLRSFRQSGAQASATQHLAQLTMIHGNWKPFELPRKPQGCEWAAATVIDGGASYLQVYFVWPGFAVHATVSRQGQFEACQWVWDSLASIQVVVMDSKVSLLRSF